MNYKKIPKKALIILVDILVYTFLIASLVFALFSLMAKKSDDGAVNVFNHQLRTVQTASMEDNPYKDVSGFEIKDIPVNSMVFIKLAPSEQDQLDNWYKDLKVGDVLTFNYLYGRQIVITHRIINIIEKTTGGYLIELSGDNKVDSSVPLTQIIDTSFIDSPNHLIGKVTGVSYFLGAIVTYLSNPLTVALCIIMPCFLIIMLQVFKIMYLRLKDKLFEKEEELRLLNEELKSIIKRKSQKNNTSTSQKNKFA